MKFTKYDFRYIFVVFLVDFNWNTFTIVKDANGVEEYVLGMVQPYKFNDTGAQIPFIDAEDAFTWLEAVKQRVVSKSITE